MISGDMRRNEAFYTLHHFTRIALSRWPRLAILQLSFLGLLVHWLNHMSNVIKMDIINDRTHRCPLTTLEGTPCEKLLTIGSLINDHPTSISFTIFIRIIKINKHDTIFLNLFVICFNNAWYLLGSQISEKNEISCLMRMNILFTAIL